MKALSTACLLAGLLWAGAAAAQPIGQASDLVIGAERLFGFYMGGQTTELPGGDRELDISTFSLLWNWNPSLLNQPRFAIDYFVINGLSVGGAFGVFSVDVEDVDGTGFLFLGRVGYLLNLGSVAGFWPRGGLLYYNLDADNLVADRDQLALELEAMFTLAPRPGWAILLGPTLDLGITGETREPPNDVDFHEYTVGVMIGMLGWVSL